MAAFHSSAALAVVLFALPAPSPAGMDGSTVGTASTTTLQVVREAYAALKTPPLLHLGTVGPAAVRRRIRGASKGESSPRSSVRVADSEVSAIVNEAARDRGVEPAYLAAVLQAESGGDPSAHAAGSSASGLFQFLRTTWLTTIRRYGSSSGMDLAASRIHLDQDGRPRVADPHDEALILALRSDATAAARMASALTAENRSRLAAVLRREPSPGELYGAHVLGWKGAAELALATNAYPSYSAARVFPSEAAANHALFFDHGRARSVIALARELARRAASRL